MPLVSVGPHAMKRRITVASCMAIAMGFAVDYELVSLVSEEELYAEADLSRWWEAAHPFSALGELIAAKGATWRYGHAMVALWRDILLAIPDETAALLIGHSGDLEIGLVACFPHADHRAWGAPFGMCEGARLGFTDHFTTIAFLRGEAQSSKPDDA